MKYLVISIVYSACIIQASQPPTLLPTIPNLKDHEIPTYIAAEQAKLKQLSTIVNAVYEAMRTTFLEHQDLCEPHKAELASIQPRTLKLNWTDFLKQHNTNTQSKLSRDLYVQLAFSQLLLESLRTLYEKTQKEILPLAQTVQYYENYYPQHQATTSANPTQCSATTASSQVPQYLPMPLPAIPPHLRGHHQAVSTKSRADSPHPHKKSKVPTLPSATTKK